MPSKLKHFYRRPARTSKTAKAIDRLALIIAFVEPAIITPQIITILVHHDASGVSLLTWIGFDCFVCVWLCYAWLHKIRALFIESALFLVMQSLVIIVAIPFGARW